MRQKNDGLAEEVELLKLRLQELEQLARGRGLTGILNFKHIISKENEKTEKTAWPDEKNNYFSQIFFPFIRGINIVLTQFLIHLRIS